jgi:hypothetical protein
VAGSGSVQPVSCTAQTAAAWGCLWPELRAPRAKGWSFQGPSHCRPAKQNRPWLKAEHGLPPGLLQMTSGAQAPTGAWWSLSQVSPAGDHRALLHSCPKSSHSSVVLRCNKLCHQLGHSVHCGVLVYITEPGCPWHTVLQRQDPAHPLLSRPGVKQNTYEKAIDAWQVQSEGLLCADEHVPRGPVPASLLGPHPLHFRGSSSWSLLCSSKLQCQSTSCSIAQTLCVQKTSSAVVSV